MARESIRDWVRLVERAAPEEQWTMLCFFAGRGVELEPDELNGAIRRAELLLAAGGDPHRPLELYGRAVSSVARDLDEPVRRAELAGALATLAPELDGLRGAGEALRLLLRDPDLAWQAFAMALLAEALSDDD